MILVVILSSCNARFSPKNQLSLVGRVRSLSLKVLWLAKTEPSILSIGHGNHQGENLRLIDFQIRKVTR